MLDHISRHPFPVSKEQSGSLDLFATFFEHGEIFTELDLKIKHFKSKSLQI